MAVSVKLFSILRVATGTGEVELDVDHTDKIYDALGEKFPEVKEKFAGVRIAVNQTFIQEGVALSDQDEVALIPPVSGG